MKADAQKNILFLAAAGLVFVVVNAGVLMAARSGQLAPVENLGLWGAFAVLNVCSLLWAVSLLGLQPLVVAFSYVAGGFLAYQGVRLLPNANMVEVTTAGATYGAFGVMVVGNAATRVRLAFFNKAQVPFVFVMLALLVMDGFLNSQVSASGWNMVLGAMVVPFVFAGIVVGAAWMVLARFGVVKESTWRQAGEVAEIPAEPIPDAKEAPALVIKRPKGAEAMAEKPAEAAPAPKAAKPAAPAPKAAKPVAPAPKAAKPVAPAPKAAKPAAPAPKAAKPAAPAPKAAKPVVALVTPEPLEKEESGTFFPLEIDKGEAVAPPEETPKNVVVESTVGEVAASEPEKAPAADSQSSNDWLNDQLEMLKNLKKKAS